MKARCVWCALACVHWVCSALGVQPIGLEQSRQQQGDCRECQAEMCVVTTAHRHTVQYKDSRTVSADWQLAPMHKLEPHGRATVTVRDRDRTRQLENGHQLPGRPLHPWMPKTASSTDQACVLPPGATHTASPFPFVNTPHRRRRIAPPMSATAHTLTRTECEGVVAAGSAHAAGAAAAARQQEEASDQQQGEGQVAQEVEEDGAPVLCVAVGGKVDVLLPKL